MEKYNSIYPEIEREIEESGVREILLVVMGVATFIAGTIKVFNL